MGIFLSHVGQVLEQLEKRMMGTYMEHFWPQRPLRLATGISRLFSRHSRQTKNLDRGKDPSYLPVKFQQYNPMCEKFGMSTNIEKFSKIQLFGIF